LKLGVNRGPCTLPEDNAVESVLADYLSHAPAFVRKFDGTILYWTTALRNSTGSPPNRRLDVSPTSFFRPPKEVAVIESRLHAEKQWRGRLRHTAHDGRTIWTESLRRLRAADHGHYRSSRA